jgi:hypothetical protein
MRSFFLALILSLLMLCTSRVSSQPLVVRPSVMLIADKIAEHNKYESARVGFAGSASEQYRQYELLVKTATKEELVLLLNHKSAAVRVYVFKGLLFKDPKAAYSHLNELNNDSATVFTLIGCIGGRSSVADLIHSISGSF